MAARPKTLTLSVAPVFMGGAIAHGDGKFFGSAFLAALIAALLIQIGTNLCNDYFDFVKGADTPERLGPTRVTAAGLAKPQHVRAAFFLTFALAALAGVYLVVRGGLPILIVGLLSIASGIAYTAGPWPLAYLGLSELFVVIFFGPVAVLGTYYVQTLELSGFAFWSGLVPGFLSASLLAVNNLRDLNQDRKANKKTLAVRLGERFARLEYTIMVAAAALVIVGLCVQHPERPGLMAPLVMLALAWPMCREVYRNESAMALNQVLANTGKLVLLIGVSLSAGYML